MSNALLNEETLQMESPIEEPKGLRARRERFPSSEEFITIRGVARVTRLLFALLLIGGFIGWAITEVSPAYVSLPGWYIPAVLAGLVLCFFLGGCTKNIFPDITKYPRILHYTTYLQNI